MDINSSLPSDRIILGAVAHDRYDDATPNGNADVTTIYGVLLDPATSLMRGFNPAELASIFIYNERMIGASGAVYAAYSSQLTTVGELPQLLPGYDVSNFTGDPTGAVYLFHTQLPIADNVPVPEPAGVALAAFGLAGLVAVVRCRRVRS